MVKRFLVTGTDGGRERAVACDGATGLPGEKLTLEESTGDAPAKFGRNDE